MSCTISKLLESLDEKLKQAQEGLDDIQKMADKFVELVKLNRDTINMYGYSEFKDLAMKCGATKTMKRGTKKYAYFGKLYVRY